MLDSMKRSFHPHLGEWINNGLQGWAGMRLAQELSPKVQAVNVLPIVYQLYPLLFKSEIFYRITSLPNTPFVVYAIFKTIKALI